MQYKMRDMEIKDTQYIQEIHTLERHIDHLTHQLELAHKAMNEIAMERDSIVNDMNS